MSRFVVIGSVEFCLGFKLIGLSYVHSVNKKEKFEKKVEEAIENKEAGILIIQDEFLSESNWKIKSLVEKTTYPVIVTVPLDTSKEDKSQNISELMKKALGFEVKR